jgi:hypothetical protein
MRMLTKRYPFKIDRRQLDVILAEGSPVVDSDERGQRPAPGTVGDRQPPQSEGAEVEADIDPAPGAAERHHRAAARKPDPRNKREAMIEGLEKALATGTLAEGKKATLTAAYRAMLHALGYTEAPTGMGEDVFAKHCKPWLKEHGIYC